MVCYSKHCNAPKTTLPHSTMTTHFFKIILSTDPRLTLPHKFISKYKESIPSVVSLDGPHGPAFKVELTPSNGEIWLDKGFQQFMDYYSIEPGYLLVFECDFESSFFHVMIFDQSAMGIDYTSTSFKGKDPEKVSSKPCCLREDTEVVSGKCIECLYDMLGEISRKRKISNGKKLEELADDVSVEILEKNVTLDDIARKRDICKRKLEEVEDGVSIEILEEDDNYEVSGHFMNGISRKRETENSEKIKTSQKRKTVSFMNPAHERAKAFVSARPSFISFMRRSYIKGELSINKRFALELSKKKSLCDVVLRVPGTKRTWTTKCRIRTWNARLWWSRFVKDNGLCEGDACVFELGNGTKPSLNVIIFRSTEDEDVKGNLRNKDLGEASRKQKISKGKKLEKVDNDDVSIEILEKDNDNEVSGNFMNGISRKQEIENLEKIKTGQKRKQRVSFMNPAHARAKAFRCTRPSFVSFMHQSYISHSLHMKKSFAMEFLKVKSACDVVLMVNGGTRTWTAKCLKSKTARLRWRTFVKDNGLCEGDSCVFELGNNIMPSLNVIIFRSSEYGEVNGNTNVGEISRKPKKFEGKKFDEVDDVSVEILEKGNDHEVSAHFMDNISAKKSARKVGKKDINEEKEEESGDEWEEKKDTKRDNKEEKDEGSEDESEFEKEEMKKASAKKDKDKGTTASAKKRNLVKGKEQREGGKSVRDDELRAAIGRFLL